MTTTNTEDGPAQTIVVDGLIKKYGDFEALSGIDFEVRAGEIVGFLGPNGAGKTTTMKILTGYMAATDGEARVAGFDVRDDSEQVRRKIGYLPENVPLYDDMIVYDYLDFVAGVREVDSQQRGRRIEEVADLTGITQVLGKTIYELSKGYRQRVGLAQAIIHEPEVIILDEPTTGLDPNQIIEIRDVITTIGEQKTIIFSTHILQEVTAVCDRIIIIDEGTLVADGTLDELEDRVAESTPGVLVFFESEERDSIRHRLEALDAVEEVTDEASRGGEVGFRVQGSSDAVVRRAIIDAEADTAMGLTSLRAVEPTLEDIFRLYTGDKLDEEAPVQEPWSPGDDQDLDELKTSATESEDTSDVVHKEVVHE